MENKKIENKWGRKFVTAGIAVLIGTSMLPQDEVFSATVPSADLPTLSVKSSSPHVELNLSPGERVGEVKGVKVGTMTAPVYINQNASGGANSGEIRIGAGELISPTGTVIPLSGGTGEAEISTHWEESEYVYGDEHFIMYVGTNMSRFTLDAYNNEKLVVARYWAGNWYYDTNNYMVRFTPNSKDFIVGYIKRNGTTSTGIDSYTDLSLNSHEVQRGTTRIYRGVGPVVEDNSATDQSDPGTPGSVTATHETSGIRFSYGASSDSGSSYTYRGTTNFLADVYTTSSLVSVKGFPVTAGTSNLRLFKNEGYGGTLNGAVRIGTYSGTTSTIKSSNGNTTYSYKPLETWYSDEFTTTMHEDNRANACYIMFAPDGDLHTRAKMIDDHNVNQNFRAVCYTTSGWRYDDNSGVYRAFTRKSNDVIVAKIFRDKVTSAGIDSIELITATSENTSHTPTSVGTDPRSWTSNLNVTVPSSGISGYSTAISTTSSPTPNTTTNTSATNWLASYSSIGGLKQVQYFTVKSKDGAGNWSGNRTFTLEAPYLTANAGTTTWTNGNVGVSVGASSGTYIVNSITRNGSALWTSAGTRTDTITANGTYTYEATDTNGFSWSDSVTINNIDKSAPTGNLAANTTAWTNGSVSLNLTGVADTGGSGVRNIELPNGTFVTGTSASYSVSANGTYSFKIHDNAGNVTTRSITVSNIETTAPTGTLTQTPTGWTNGNVTLNLTSIADAGGSGYYRTKLPNGTYVSTTTASQVVTDDGTYSFVIYDNAGNSTTKTITVSNIDKTPPTGNLTSSVSNGEVTLSLTSIADTGGSGYYRTRLPNGTYVTTTSASYQVDTNGTYSFIIYDNAGNSTTKSINVTNADTTPPTGTLAQTPTTPTNGDVTLNLTGVSDAGTGVKSITRPNGTVITSGTTSASEVVSANGTYTFTMEDNAGNKATRSITVTNIDKVAPTGTLTQTPTGWTKGNVTLNLTSIADTGGSGYYRTKLPNGSYVSTTTASQTVTDDGTYSFVIYDNAGNSTTRSITVSNIDKVAPVGTLSASTTAWTKNDVTLNLTAISDAGGSGYYRTKLPNGSYVTTTSASQVVSANGTYTFVIYDNAGNETEKTMVVSNIDKNAPTGNLAQTPTTWTNGTVTLNLTGIADTGSSSYYRTQLPNGTFVTTTSASYVVTVNGTYTFKIYDNAGNETVKTITVTNMEKTAPTANVSASTTAWTNQNVTLTLSSIADAGGSGLKSVTLPNNSVISPVSATSYTHVVTANGTYDFEIEDHAGNSTTKTIVVSNIDKSAPNGNVSASTTAFTNADVTLTFNGITETGGAGLKQVTLPNGSVISPVSASSYTHVVSVNGTYNFKIEDHAGNMTTKSITVSNIDKSSPTGTLSASTTAWTKDNVTLNLTSITDVGVSGIRHIQLPSGTFVTGTSVSYVATSNGTYSFVIFDNAGNSTTRSITVPNMDKTLPVLNLSYNASTNVISASASDAGGSGLKEITRPDGTKVTGTSTTFTPSTFGDYSFSVSDNAGNVTTKSIFADRIISIPDDGLRQVLLTKVGQQFGITATVNHITESRLSQLTGDLDAKSKNIQNLQGLEYLDNISKVYLNSNPVSNVTSLQNLTQLHTLDISGTSVSDISSLNKLTNLVVLDIENSNVSNLTSLTPMSQLQILTLSGTPVADLTPLTNLTNLTNFVANDTNITSLAPLQKSTKMKVLHVEENALANLTGLSGMTQLTDLKAGQNLLTNISAIKNLTTLTSIDLNSNKLTSSADLTNLVNVTTLNVSSNILTNIAGTTNMSKLAYLDIETNRIVSISELSNKTLLKTFLANDNRIWDLSPLANKGTMTGFVISNNLVGKLPTNLNGFADSAYYNNFIPGKSGQNTLNAISSQMMEEDALLNIGVTYTTIQNTWTSKVTPNVTITGNSGITAENVKWNTFRLVTNSPSNGVGTVTYELNPDVKRTFQVTVLAVMPEVVVTPTNGTAWTNGTVTLDVRASNRVTDIARIFLPNGTSILASETQYVVSKNGIYGFAVLDGYGRLNYTYYEVRNIDTKAPSVSVIVPGNWSNTDPTIQVDVIND